MGVRGLQSFLKNNQRHFADDISVGNISIVIDGNNLLCLLFAEMCLDAKSPHYRNDIYGGDYVAYAQVIREFFSSLDKCNIKPIVVFDGSTVGKKELSDFVATKERCVYQRGLERFHRSLTMREFPGNADGDRNKILLPTRLSILFKGVCKQLNVKIIQSPYEADTHLARVANDLNCPVLTNDSDFIIYSLKRGFILIDTFNYKRPVKSIKTGQFVIDAQLFSQRRVIKSLPGLKVESMPLLSVLLGNDYVDAGTFDRVIASICNPYYNGHLEVATFSHRRIANLLTWLQRHSLDDSIAYILDLVHPSYRHRLEQCIKFFLKNYKIELADDFVKELEIVYPRDKLDLNTPPEMSPANYLRNLLEADDLSGIALDMIFKNTHYNYAILDDPTLPTSSIPMFRPYSLALVLLRSSSYTGLTTIQRLNRIEKDSFNYYDRVGDQYTNLRLKPLDSLENFGSLEHLDLYSMLSLDGAFKKTLLMATFRFNLEEYNLMSETMSQVLVEPGLSDATVCFMLLKYISLEMSTRAKPQFVDALVLTIFYYSALKGSLNKASFTDDAYGQLLLKLRPHSLTNNGIEYKDEPHLYRRIVHMIAQLQAAFKGYALINTLLAKVFPQSRHDIWFNSVLMFRITKLLRTSQETIEDLCKNLPNLLDACKSVRVQVHCDAS